MAEPKPKMRYRLFEDDSNRKRVRYIAVIEKDRKTVEAKDFGPNRDQARAALRRAETEQSLSFSPPPEVVRAVVESNGKAVFIEGTKDAMPSDDIISDIVASSNRATVIEAKAGADLGAGQPIIVANGVATPANTKPARVKRKKKGA